MMQVNQLELICNKTTKIQLREKRNVRRRLERLENNLTGNANSGHITNNLLKFTINLCCAIGCLQQGYQLANAYLEYPVRAQTLFYPIDPVIPPSLSICLYRNYKQPCPLDTCLNSTTKFFNSVFSISEITTSIHYLDPNGTRWDFKKNSVEPFLNQTVSSFVVHGLICHTVNYMKMFSSRLFTNFHIHKHTHKLIFAIEINATSCKEPFQCDVHLSTHDDINIPHPGRVLQLGDAVVYTYTKRSLELLPFPYVTNCRDYIKEGMTSQDDCLVKCGKSMDIENDRPLSRFVPVLKGEHYRLNILPQNQIPDSCGIKCSEVACVSEQYTPVVAYSYKPLMPSIALIGLNFPETTDLNVTYQPLTTFWDFVTLFSSIFGVWFGISVFSTFDFATRKLEHFCSFAELKARNIFHLLSPNLNAQKIFKLCIILSRHCRVVLNKCICRIIPGVRAFGK